MAYKKVLHLERVTIFDRNPTVCMPSCCPRATFSSTHYSSNQGSSAIFPPYKTEYIFSKRYRNVANFSWPLERFELFPWIKNKSVSGPAFLYRRIWQPGVWRFLQQPMVPRTVAARVYHSHTEQQSIARKELFPSIFLAWFGAPNGPASEYSSGAITSQLLTSLTPSLQKYQKLWTLSAKLQSKPWFVTSF